MKPQVKTYKEKPRLNYHRIAMGTVAFLIILNVVWWIGSVKSSLGGAAGVESNSSVASSTTETDIDGALDDQGVGVLPPIDAIPVYWAPQGRYFFTFIGGEMYRINLTGIERYHVTAYLEAPQ